MAATTRTPYEDTSVAVERSKEQIRTSLRTYGALGVEFLESWEPGNPRCSVRFVWPLKEGDGLRQLIRIDVTPLPPKERPKVTEQQRERQAWRGIAHYLEANLKAAHFGLVRFEDVFLAFMELPEGHAHAGERLGDVVLGRLNAGQPALPPGD
jgi:hypothetical protein